MAVQFKVPRCWICCYMAQTPNITRADILQTDKHHNLTTKNHRRPWFRNPIPVQPASPSPLLGIAPSRRWRDPKDCRRYPKVPQGYAEGSAKMTKHQPKGSSKMTKHRRVRRGPAPEGGALNRRDASGSAEAKDDDGEVPRSLSKVVAKGRRTSRNPEVPRTVRSHTLECYDKNLRVQRAT